MATNFRVKISEIGQPPPFVVLAFQNGVECRNSEFKHFNGDDMATSCKNLVNFGPVTQEFTRAIRVHPSLISSLATFAWLRHC